MKVYAAARDLAGYMPIGTHQFIIIETSKTIPIAIDDKKYLPV